MVRHTVFTSSETHQ